ncbi:MAG: hypothetical protein PHD61_04660 [Bacteroidales bacterium]|nr:hypothetical protein [Lentimicrobiaceae bacterium]MDD5694581.1 hypothetical protein [Bacteroidales bacterium]
MKEKTRKLSLAVTVHLQDAGGKDLPEGMVYIYDRSGKFLMAEKISGKDKGETLVELPSSMMGQSVRMIVGPVTEMAPKEKEIPLWMETLIKAGGEDPYAPSKKSLLRLGSVSKNINLDKDHIPVNIAVYPYDWRKWLTCHCLVRGRLIKRVSMPDGTVQEWGVCQACIKIYEVDAFPMIIAKLPDYEIFRLRDDLIAIIKEKIKLPPREVIPLPWPPPPLITKISDAKESAMAAGDIPSEAGDYVELPADFTPVVSAVTASQLRSELILNKAKWVKYLCLVPWFMKWYKKDLIKCTCTDENGYFETVIDYTCGGDHPDLYFKAVQCIGGVLHTLYDPGMVCHTYWDYPCGTEVVLETKDPAARVCAPSDPVIPPAGVGTWVLINKVGGILIDSIGSDGLVGYDFSDAGGHIAATGAPFGGTLGLRASHSVNIPSSSLKYYRWLYNKDGDLDLLGNPVWYEFNTPVAPSVTRYYADYDLAHPSKPPTFPVYTLGPKSIKGKTMYEFRPTQTELQALAPPNHVYQWPAEPIGNDIYSGILNSVNLPGGTNLAYGKYGFKLEIYDSAGDQVLPGAGTFRFIVLQNADGDSRLPYAGEIQDGGFIFCLNIDNRRCQALIDAPKIGTVGANPLCGFLHFAAGDSVTLDFHALHPSERATFSYWIRRGAMIIKSISGEVAADDAGEWDGDHHGNFHGAFPPASLLGPCTQAAFAEVLRVYAKATNGWTRLDEYDAGTEWAFALTPAT